MMTEAFSEEWQDYKEVDDKGVQKEFKTHLVSACNMEKINLISSQPLFQGKLTNTAMPNSIGGFNTASRHIQFVRSIPTRCLISTLVGMKEPRNVNYNLELVKIPPMTREAWTGLLKPGKRTEYVEEEL